MALPFRRFPRSTFRAHTSRTIILLALLGLSTAAAAQPSAPGGFGACKPISQRTSELGCWIITDSPVGRIEQPQVFWHLDAYPTRAAAEAAKESGGTVVEALGKTWLSTIGPRGWRPAHAGKRVAEIGPLQVTAGKEYSAVYMEAIMTPGMTSSVHSHSGPEAWYTEAGETCLETPQGTIVGSAGKPAIVPAGPPMFLTAIGKAKRRSITLILHDASQPPTTMVHDWKPKGLCGKK